MNIYTLTLNPAYDVHAFTGSFVPYHENFADVTSRDAGGKGVNISRALTAAGVENTALVVLGRENGAEFKESLAKSGVRALYLEKPGRIRENLTLHEADGRETRISFSGFRVNDSLLEEVSGRIAGDTGTVVTFTGSVPDGVSMDAVREFLRSLKAKGVRIVLDSRSFSLEDIYAVEPWLVKPNQQEVSAFFGCEVATVQDAVEKAQAFFDHGVANAMISLGDQGAVLACEAGIFLAQVPQISVVSTIGAGDSSIAGFLAAAARGETPENCLRNAVAFGTAACRTVGSLPPIPADIEEILPAVSVTKVK